MEKNTPKQFVLQLGSLLALYVSITTLLVLLFNVINLLFPDAVTDFWMGESSRSAIRFSIAALVVFFPTYLVLTRLSNQDRRKENAGHYTTLTRWLIYLSLLVAGGVLLGDLVTLIMYFLNGEITTRFLYKVVTLLFVIGFAFHYYVQDVRGYFIKHVTQSLYFAIGSIVVVAASVLFGFSHIETPTVVREMRIDQQEVSDLQTIQSRIEEYYRVNSVLPTSITQTYGSEAIPQAPSSRPGYTYQVTDRTHYSLCATFSSDIDATGTASPVVPSGANNYSWNYTKGLHCFTRIIDPNTLK